MKIIGQHLFLFFKTFFFDWTVVPRSKLLPVFSARNIHVPDPGTLCYRSSLAILYCPLQFQTQWALNGALKHSNNSQLIKNCSGGFLMFHEQNEKPGTTIPNLLCAPLYQLLSALQSWKEEVDGREETGWGTLMPEHTGREMVQCWCNSASWKCLWVC